MMKECMSRSGHTSTTYARDDKPKFYYYVYRNSTELVENDIEFINNRLTLYDDYQDCLNEAILIGLILIL